MLATPAFQACDGGATSLTGVQFGGPPAPRGWWRDAVVLAGLGVGALLRLTLLATSELWSDEATTGIMGLAVLRGERPVYFYGQPFMGALDAYLAAPLYWLFGISARTLELLPVLISIAWLGVTIALAAEAFGLRAARYAALWLAVPPSYLLYWAHEGRVHYGLLLPLGTLAFWLALRVPGMARPRTLAGYGLLGLVLGVAFWTNFLAVVLGPPVAVLVWLRTGGTGSRDRLRRLAPALMVAPGLVLGSLPHWVYGLRHGTAIPYAGVEEGMGRLVPHVIGLARRAWPKLVGVPSVLFDGPAAVLLGALAALGYAAAAVAAVRAPGASGRPARPLAVALTVLVLTTVGLAVGTVYGDALADDARYLLPLYIALPVLLGQGMARLSGRLATAALAAVLLFHAVGAVSGELQRLAPSGIQRIAATNARWRATIATLERSGVCRIYGGPHLRHVTFLSGEQVILSDSYQEVSSYYARAVDGAERIGWNLGDRSPDFEASLAAAGVGYRFSQMGPVQGTYTDFALTQSGAARELPAERLRVTASALAEMAPRMVDRDGATLWSTGASQRGGEWIVVDLGTVERVSLVRWLPGWYQQVPAGVRVETSRDGRAWTLGIDAPAYQGPLYWSASHPMGRVRAGRVELRIPPTPARFLRITQTGRQSRFPWTIRELFVYTAIEASDGPIEGRGHVLADALRTARVRRLYADHGWASRVALADPTIRVPTSNLFHDSYGYIGRADDFLARVQWDSRSAALLEPLDADGFERMATTSGLGFTRRDLGGLVLFLYAPPPTQAGSALPAGMLRVTASVGADGAARAVDRVPETHWTTGRRQLAGDSLRVDLAEPRQIVAARFWTMHRLDWPRALAVEVSPDGIAWRPLDVTRTTEGELRWGGIALVRDGLVALRLDFPPVRASALRFTLTAGDPTYHWTVHELTVVGVDER